MKEWMGGNPSNCKGSRDFEAFAKDAIIAALKDENDDSTIDLTTGKIVTALTVTGCKVVVNNDASTGASQDGKVSGVTVDGTATISGAALIDSTTLTLNNASTTAILGAGTIVSTVDGAGNLIVSKGAATTGAISSTGTISVAEGATLNTGAISNVTSISGEGTLDAGSQNINVGTGTIEMGTITGGTITATLNANDKYTVKTLKTTDNANLTIGDASGLSNVDTISSADTLGISDDISGVTNISSTRDMTIANATYVGKML